MKNAILGVLVLALIGGGVAYYIHNKKLEKKAAQLSAGQLVKDNAIIQAYLKKNHATARKTAGGTSITGCDGRLSSARHHTNPTRDIPPWPCRSSTTSPP